jgi:phage gpG-like protein
MSSLDTYTSVNWDGEKLKQAVQNAVSATVTESALKLQKKIHEKLSKKDNSGGMSPARSGSPPAMITGALRNSWNVDLSRIRSENPTAVVSSNLRYAAILEYGSQRFGRITPKSKKFLTIPLNEDAVRMRRRNKDLRQVDGLFILPLAGQKVKSGKRKGKRLKGKRGRDTLILAMDLGNGKVRAMFALVKSVYINKHPYIRPSLESVRKKINKKLGKLVAAEIKFELGGL